MAHERLVRRKQHASVCIVAIITLCALAASTGQLRLLWKAKLQPSALFAASIRNRSSAQQQEHQQQHQKQQQQHQQQQTGLKMSVPQQVLRHVVQTVPGMKLSEGAGVQIRRTVCICQPAGDLYCGAVVTDIHVPLLPQQEMHLQCSLSICHVDVSADCCIPYPFTAYSQC